MVCRVRPRPPAESTDATCVQTRGAEVTLEHPADGSLAQTFAFDAVFDGSATNADVFATIVPTLEDVRRGVNGAVLAYGQSGAGKSHTMNGSAVDPGLVARVRAKPRTAVRRRASDPPRSRHPLSSPRLRASQAVAHLTAHREAREAIGEDARLSLTAVELYNERLVDLLADRSAPPLQVVVDPRRGVWTRGAVEINLRDGTDVDAILARANARRAVGATGLNADSSRSHLIIALSLERPRMAVSSKLFLVDLAGAEKVRRSGAAGSRLDEACGINKSLSALGNVVAALTAAEGAEKTAEKTASAAERNDASLPRVFRESSAARESPHPHVPYRDSKLTRLLQEALGGDARATLVTCLSPSAADAAESLSTLRFGARARNVVGVAKPKIRERFLSEEAAAALRDELRSARDELARLRAECGGVEEGKGTDESGSGTGEVAREGSRTAGSTVPALALFAALSVAYSAVDFAVFAA